MHVGGDIGGTYGSLFLEEKDGQEIRFLVPELLSKYKRSIIFGMPCRSPRSCEKRWALVGRWVGWWVVS